MPYTYRRPFDYPQHRHAFNVWAMQGLVEGVKAAGAFTGHAATITSAGATGDRLARGTRFAAAPIYRRRWPYAEHQARIILIYTDADAISAETGRGAFTGHIAAVQVGVASGATVGAGSVSVGLTTYDATIEGDRRDPLADAIGQLATYQALLTRTAGLGQSRTGATQAKASGTYVPGSTRVGRKRVASLTNRITRAK